MTLFLIGTAACFDGAETAHAAGLDRVYLLASGQTQDPDDCEYRSEAQLSALMLTPGLQIYWC